MSLYSQLGHVFIKTNQCIYQLIKVMDLVTTLSIDVQHNSFECHYAECRDYLNVMLSVVMLNVVVPKK
jgi:hypothetical protein